MKFPIIGTLVLLTCSSVSQQGITKVALEDVLKDPSRYQGRLVQIRGFLLQEYENSALYADEKWRGTKGIWITATSEWRKLREMNRHYVVLTGVFDANDHGHLGQFKGLLNAKKFVLAQDDGKPPNKGPK